MATFKTAGRTSLDSSTLSGSRLNSGKLVEAKDYHAYAVTEVDAGDVLLTNIYMPSNAILSEVLVITDSLGATCTMDIGLYAKEKFVKTVSATDTVVLKDAVLDVDLFVDGADFSSALTKFTPLALDTTTCGADDIYKPLWELLGYDKDPRTTFGVVASTITSATPAAGDTVFLVRYSID